jgi:hypothetical protein
MALLNKIIRGNLHERILTNSTTHTIQEKKSVALNYVLNALKINKDDNDVQNVIKEITRCLTTSFFNRYSCVCLFIYIYIFILFYRSANDR